MENGVYGVADDEWIIAMMKVVAVTMTIALVMVLMIISSHNKPFHNKPFHNNPSLQLHKAL